MVLKDYLRMLNHLVESNPEILEMNIIYGKDDEGNDFDYVNYTPSIGYFDPVEAEFSVTKGDSDSVIKVVCLN